jgi:hypothetical protein
LSRFVALLAVIALFAVRQPYLLDHANLAVFVANPSEALTQAALLRYSPVNLDPLLLMAILHFGLLVVLPVMIRWPTPTLIASAALYFVSHWLDWSLPAYPRGEIYFNPLRWQLLYVIGMWWGMKSARERLGVLKSRVLCGLAAIYLLFSFFITLGWHFHSVEAYCAGSDRAGHLSDRQGRSRHSSFAAFSRACATVLAHASLRSAPAASSGPVRRVFAGDLLY